MGDPDPGIARQERPIDIPGRPILPAAGAYLFYRFWHCEIAHSNRPHLPPPINPSGRGSASWGNRGSMFEGQPQAELEAMMKASPGSQLFHHQELDKQVLDANLACSRWTT